MAVGRHRLDTRCDFGARRKLHQRVCGHAGKGAPHVLEGAFHASRRSGHAGVVHPEGVLGGGHHDLGIWEGPFTGLVAQPVDVVAMKMADEHRVDVGRLHARRAQTVQQLARGGAAKLAQAGVDEDFARAGHHQKRGVRHIDVVGGKTLGRQQRTHFGQRRVFHKLFAQRAACDAVVQGKHLHIAHLHAAKAGAGQGGRAEVRRILRPHRDKRARCVNGGGQACAQEVTS